MDLISASSGPLKHASSSGAIFLRNGWLLLVPVLAISIGLWSRLPSAYGGEAFDQNVPSWLIVCENMLRGAVLLTPLVLYFGRSDRLQVVGWYAYTSGVALYLGSYLAQIYSPDSRWSTSAIGFTAPAWTTAFWLAGVGLVCAHTWLHMRWNRAVYLCIASAFVTIHVAHAYLAFIGGSPA